MDEKEIRVRTADGEMTTFVVRPDGDGPFPVAVVYMDGVGYREQVKKNARRFAADGYYCVAPDLYYRAGEKLSFDMSTMATGFRGPEAERMMKAASSVTLRDGRPPRLQPRCGRAPLRANARPLEAQPLAGARESLNVSGR
jgi:dienelactone hydrolase